MARSAFERVIELQLSQFSPEQARLAHIAIAREGLAAFLAGQEQKPLYQIETDGHASASEDSVRPFGIIAYRFRRLPEIGRYAIAAARELSPNASGRYKHSWFLLADGAEVAETAIPPAAQLLILTNDQPYARKIQTRGARLQNIPPGIVERARQLVLRRYGALVVCNVEFIELRGGLQLKRGRVRRGKRERVLTYPALIMRPKV